LSATLNQGLENCSTPVTLWVIDKSSDPSILHDSAYKWVTVNLGYNGHGLLMCCVVQAWIWDWFPV